jgi:lipase
MSDIKPGSFATDIGDARIDYLLWESEGPPLLLLHATGFLPWLWHPIARELSRDFKVFAPSLCSHRQADPQNGGLSWVQLADDIAAFCKSLEIHDPFVVGHSMGGAVLTIAAGDFGVACSRMVLIEPIFLPEAFYGISIRVEDHPLASKSIKRRNYWEDRGAVQHYLESKLFFSAWDGEMLGLYKQHAIVAGGSGGFELACHPLQEASLFMGSMARNPWPLMPEIACPVLVVEGETSENREIIDLKKVARTFKHGHYLLVEGAGHLVPMEKPALVLSTIQTFFDGG